MDFFIGNTSIKLVERGNRLMYVVVEVEKRPTRINCCEAINGSPWSMEMASPQSYSYRYQYRYLYPPVRLSIDCLFVTSQYTLITSLSSIVHFIFPQVSAKQSPQHSCKPAGLLIVSLNQLKYRSRKDFQRNCIDQKTN